MANLYNVTMKIGKRSFSTNLYAVSPDNILTFCQNNLLAKVIKISQIVYDVSDTASVPADDVNLYKKTVYYTVRNDTAKKSAIMPFQTVKLTRTTQEVFDDMKLYLDLDKTSSITSSLSVSSSTI